MQARLLLFEQADNALPVPLLVMFVGWLTAIFTSFGLFAPRNVTVIAARLDGTPPPALDERRTQVMPGPALN